jgi:peptidoglycan hydrolase-like protein with peptidoglycan-binding domain
MEKNKNFIVSLVLLSLLSFMVAPYNNVSAQSCDPSVLVPVKFGQRGNAVKNLQACLIEAGYDIPAGVTGYYGAQTRNAVKQFYSEVLNMVWSGNNIGAKGIAELKNLLSGVSESETPSQQQSQQQSQQNQTAAIVAAVIAALQQMGVISTSSQQQQAASEEGLLTVDKDPRVSINTLREGQTARVAGIRFKAENGSISIKSMTLRWEAPVAPYRAITSLRIIDENNNEIYKLSNIGPTSFSQDSSLKYYLPITGLNIEVPKNGYKSVFVEVTAVGTYPSSLTGQKDIIKIRQNDIRGRDRAGIDRFGPSDPNGLTYQAKFEATLASSASIISNLNVNSPKSKYLVSDDYNTGLGNKVKVLSFDLKAKNDDLRITQIQGIATGSANITAVYITPAGDNNTVYDVKTPNDDGEFTLDISNSNVVINKDQIKSFDILVDFEAPTAGTIHTTTISISTTTAYSLTLGDTKDHNTNVNGSLMYITRVAPEFTLVNKDLDRSYNSTSNQSTVSRVRYEINIKAVGADVYLVKTNGLKVQFSGPVTATTRDIDISEVRDVAGNIISAYDTNYYKIPEGNTYKVIYDETFATPITYTGDIKITAEVTELKWDNDTSGTPHAATFFGVYPEYKFMK